MVFSSATPAMPDMRAERVQCALQNRVLGFGSGIAGRHRRAILLTAGGGMLTTGDDEVTLVSPCLAWVPWRQGRQLTIFAGGVGYQFAVGDEILVDAIGTNPESVDLRYLADRRVIASLENEADMLADCENAFDVIVRELHRPRNGSWTMMLAQVRAVLVFAWRLSGVEEFALRAQGESSRILQRFRQLVEMHFRDRWTVGAYARAIGISHDRLHDICRRELDRTPIQLIHERAAHEARLRLERSALSVEQVAGSLGFRDVGHFSRFFKAKVGLPPAAYRQRVALSLKRGDRGPQSNYADWP